MCFHYPHVSDRSPTLVELFLIDLHNTIHLQCCNLVTDFDKSIYLSTWLQDGSLKSWFCAIKKTNPQLLHVHATLIVDFWVHFGNSNFINSQMLKIEHLTQHSSAVKYVFTFCKIMVHLPIHDNLIKINMFKKGLWSNVKALFITLTGSNMPTTDDAYISQAITSNNSLHAQAQDLKVKHDNLALHLLISLHASSAAPSMPQSAALTDPVPMEVNAICHHEPVSTQEHKHCHGKASVHIVEVNTRSTCVKFWPSVMQT